jgi:hypothetical protein
MKSMPLHVFLALPQETRKRIKVGKGRRRNSRSPREKRPHRNDEELIGYLRDNDIHTVRQLARARLRKPGQPAPWDYIKRWGSWSKAKEAAWGPPIDRLPGFDDSPEYMIQTILAFDLWSFRKYQRARGRMPGAMCSTHALLKAFGSWSNAKAFALRRSLREQVRQYIALKQELGRHPNAKELRAAGVDHKRLWKVYGGWRGMRAFWDSAEAAFDKLYDSQCQAAKS